jgi:hypothetical protein
VQDALCLAATIRGFSGITVEVSLMECATVSVLRTGVVTSVTARVIDWISSV